MFDELPMGAAKIQTFCRSRNERHLVILVGRVSLPPTGKQKH